MIFMPDTSSAFIAIVGCPNAGKSSLMNHILGQKVSIVSSKPQTTRTRITGVLTEKNSQFVFIDTPGLHLPKNQLGSSMVKAVADGMADVDGAVLVTEPRDRIMPAEEELMKKFRAKKIPAVLAINKIDTLKNKEGLLEIIARFGEAFPFSAVVPLCALTGEGVPALMQELQAFLQPGPFYFEENMLTDQPERVIAAELLREKLLTLLEKEIPHGIAVFVEQMKEREDSDILDISCTIFCEKESHKGIVIGKKGALLKRASTLAREDMEHFFGCRVNLQTWVKVKEDWRNRAGIIHSLGLD